MSSRVGEKRLMNCGIEAKIVAYRKYIDIDVEFSDGSKRYNVSYGKFKRGAISSKGGHSNMSSIRVGEKRLMNCGLEATIIAYRSSADIDVKFSNGFISKNRTYANFKKGEIASFCIDSHKVLRLGEKRMMSCGMESTIIAYRSFADIDVKFDDGIVVTNKSYASFLKGQIAHVDNRVGEKRLMNCGLEATIIAYRSSTDIDIKFEDGVMFKHKIYASFSRGTIGHPSISVQGGGTLSSFTIKKLAYRLKDQQGVFYVCECQRCKLRDILTPREMLDHKCEVITSEQAKA